MMSYTIEGVFLEACDCRVTCPCWFDESAHDDECTGIIAWHVDKGTIDDIDVSNLTVVSVSHHEGHRHSGGQEVVLVIGQDASDEQAEALQNVFLGRRGGPLEELHQLTGPEPIIRRAPVQYTHDGQTTKVTVGEDASMTNVEMFPLVGALGRITTLADSALARVLGTPSDVGKSRRLQISVDRAPLETNVENRSASRGRFSYHHTEASKGSPATRRRRTPAA
jgi:hypothetical protein